MIGNLFRSASPQVAPLSTPSAIAPGLTAGPAGVWAWCLLPTQSTDAIGTAALIALTHTGASDLKQVLPRDVEFHIKVQWGSYSGQEHYEREAARWPGDLPAGVDAYLSAHAQRLDDLALPRRQILLGVRLDDASARQTVKERVLASSDTTKTASARLQEYAALAAKWHARMAATSFHARPATVTELAWSLRRDMHRKVSWLPDGPLAGPAATARLRAGEVLVESDHVKVRTDDGARYLRCLTPTVLGFPSSGMELPGGEWLRDLLPLEEDPDITLYPVEISVRGRAMSPASAHKRISTALKLLKEQGREAAAGVAEEPPEALLEARDALTARQADLSGNTTSMVQDNPVWIIEADDLDTLNYRTDQVIDQYAARQIELWPATNLQGELWRSTVLGDRLRVRDFEQFRPLSTLVGSWFHGGSSVGSESGPLLGYTTGSTPSPYRDRFSDAAVAGAPVTSAFLGRSGAGKSTALVLTVLAEARYGAWVFLLDMKGDLVGCVSAAEMFEIPTLALSADEVSSGSMCPFGYMPPEEARGAVLDLLLMALRRSMTDLAEPVVRRAVMTVSQYPNPTDRSTHAVIELLANSRDDAAARSLGHEFRDLATDRMFAPIAGEPAAQRQTLPTSAGLVYMAFPPSALPDRGSQREEWSPSERLAMTLLRASFRYGKYMSSRVSGIPKVIALPELHTITAHDIGRTMVKETALMGRAQDTLQLLDTQACVELAAIDGLADQLSTVLAFQVDQDEEAAAQAQLLGRPADAEFVSGQKQLAKGECVVRDRERRFATVYFDRIAAEIAEAISTTPERDDREDLAG